MTLVQKGADALTVLRSHESRRKFTALVAEKSKSGDMIGVIN